MIGTIMIDAAIDLNLHYEGHGLSTHFYIQNQKLIHLQLEELSLSPIEQKLYHTRKINQNRALFSRNRTYNDHNTQSRN